MEKEKAFKKGDKITYKSIYDCTHFDGRKNSYYYGGNDQGGHVGEIRNYSAYVEEKQCWRISVTTIKGGELRMLECDFLEYDIQAKSQDLFPIY